MSNNLKSLERDCLNPDEEDVIEWDKRLRRTSFIVDMVTLFLFFVFAAIFTVFIVFFRTFTTESRVENNNNINTPPFFSYERKNKPPNASHVTFPSK